MTKTSSVAKADAKLADVVYGKLPPQAPDLEEAVLGAMMIDRDAVPIAIDIVKPEMFYSDANRLICEAIVSLFNKTSAIDILTVTQELKSMGVLEEAGGPFYVTSLTSRVASSAHVEHHARIISQKFIQRELIKISTVSIHNAYEDTTDVFELLSTGQASMAKLVDGLSGNRESHVASYIEELSKSSHNGFPLTRLIEDLKASPTDLVIIAARPSMGKTAFALQIARELAEEMPVGILSMEMGGVQLASRLIVAESSIHFNRVYEKTLHPNEGELYRDATLRLEKLPIYIDQQGGLNIQTARAKISRMVARHGIKILLVDYLQLMSGRSERGQNREQEISEISRGLKAIAKQFEIPVIALSQLSRAVENRPSKRPMLSDLRESGAIEQDADVVAFMYRPEYYGVTEDEDGYSTAGLCEVIISKNRNGALGTHRITFEGEYMRFKPWVSKEYVPAIGGTKDRPSVETTDLY